MSLYIRMNLFEYLSTVTIQYVSAQKNPKDSSLFEVTFYLQLLKTIFTFLTQFLSRYTRVIKIHDMTVINITHPYLVCPIAEYSLAISFLRNSRYIKLILALFFISLQNRDETFDFHYCSCSCTRFQLA